MAGIEKTGDWAAVEKMFAQAGEKLMTNVKRATAQAGQTIVAEIEKRFQQEGPGWKSWSYAYALYRKRKFGGGKILSATGTLQKSAKFKPTGWDGGEVSMLRRVGNVDLAWVHEFGTADGRIPPRPFFFPAVQAALPAIMKLYEEAVESAFK